MRIAALIGLLLFGLTLIAQDTLIYRSGESLLVSVRNVSIPTSVSYKLHSNQKGPTYTAPLYDIFQIRYENGSIDEFNYDPPAPPPRDTVVITKTDTTHSKHNKDPEQPNGHHKLHMINYLAFQAGVVFPQGTFDSNELGSNPASGFAEQGFLGGIELRVLFLRYLGVMFKAEYTYYPLDIKALQNFHGDSILSNTNWQNVSFTIGSNLNIPLFTQHLCLEIDASIGVAKMYRPKLEFNSSSQKNLDYVGVCYEIGGGLRANITPGFGLKLFSHYYNNRVEDFNTFKGNELNPLSINSYKGGISLLYLF